ncbi:purine nucleoside phosphorylase [Clonorchis sinensis]|uniref:Purine nucleoside phosphorylase n=1 Tax=Clonorchis sinensis TaxID=79923 RepID=H2KSM1_CLOSI|nr:purine nucleoside phosphorylase [Clonorchis sinensis]
MDEHNKELIGKQLDKRTPNRVFRYVLTYLNCTGNCALFVNISWFGQSRIQTTANFEDVNAIAQFIKSKVDLTPEVGIICGSGLGKLADAVQNSKVLAYRDISGFPQSTVEGHKGNLVFGTMGDKKVVVMQGRFHPYEGYSNHQIAIPIRVMKQLGVKTILASNAAGALNRQLKLGDLVMIKDHIYLPGLCLNNVLVGKNEDRFGPRFPAISDAYDPHLRLLFKQIAEEQHVSDAVQEGVYVFCGGPAYESIAECKMLLMMGADVTGMSTVPEVVVARHCGMKVFAVSLITNISVMDYGTKQAANHDEVLEVATKRTELLQRLFEELIKRM